jgi:hypothetical protein
VRNVLSKAFQRRFAILLLYRLHLLTIVLTTQLAVIARLTILTGLNTKYSLRYTSIQSSSFSPLKTVQLRHYPNSPTLTVECCQFHATEII